MDFSFVAICAIIVLVAIFIVMAYSPVTKIELLFIDNIPVICLHKRRFFLFLSTYVEKYRNVQKTYIRSKTVPAGKHGHTQIVYDLVMEFKRERKNISKLPLDTSEIKKIVIFQDETSDAELKKFSDKLNEALKNEEDCIISVKGIKSNLQKCILTYVIGCPVFAVCLLTIVVKAEMEISADKLFSSFFVGYLIAGLILAFLIFMSFRANSKYEKNKYSLNSINERESAEIDKINNSIIK